MLRELAIPGDARAEPRVWTWEQLWSELGRTIPDPPRQLATAGARAVCLEAIARAAQLGAVEALGDLRGTAGFRRRIRSRMAAWTLAGLDPRRDGPRGPSAIDRAEWAIFAEYRRLLAQTRCVDAEGLANVASRALVGGRARLADAWDDLDLVIVDPPGREGPEWAAIGALHERVRGLHVALPSDPSRVEAFAALGRAHARLTGWGFHVEAVEPDAARPSGLRTVENALFPDDPGPRPPSRETEGLAFLGAPEGDGIGLVVASRLRGLLSEPGTEPEDVAVAIPRWDESARVVAETVRSWGIPIADDDPTRSLASDPAVTALVHAIRLPIDDWNTKRLVRFLRNGQVRPRWPEAALPLALAAAASMVREARVYRGAEAILTMLKRAADAISSHAPPSDLRRRERTASAADVVGRLVRVLDPLDRAAPWWSQVEKLAAVRVELGIGVGRGPGAVAVEALLDALDDHGGVLEAFGQADVFLTWEEFVREVHALAREVLLPARPPRPGAVRFATPEVLAGARFRHVVLVNLIEGTFPDREAIDLDPAIRSGEESEGEPGASLAFSGEMLRYLRLVASADRTLTFVSPTTDEKGQALLPAGFLEETRELFDPEALDDCTESIRRLSPVLPETLAGSPRERRIRAVARVSRRDSGGEDELRRLAELPEHRTSLEGTAAALHVSGHRSGRRKSFGPYDGMIVESTAVQRIAADFHTERYTFSASQLESLAFCPFQFFQRYVLRLSPIQELDEIDEDPAARGNLIHDALEKLYKAIMSGEIEVGLNDADALLEPLLAKVDALLARYPDPHSRIEAGLRVIEAERIRRMARRYVRQHQSYLEKAGQGAVPRLFEAAFGREEDSGAPALEIGRPPEVVRLQGKIDRVDTVDLADGLAFRVIDYKSGSAPGKGHLTSGIALQLPLYALAAERILLADRRGRPLDAGYWALRGEGYKALAEMATLEGDEAIPTDLWESLQEAIERYVLDLVARLRVGAFPVAPRSDDCTRTCDYRVVCRIKQTRQAGKQWAQAPRLDLET